MVTYSTICSSDLKMEIQSDELYSNLLDKSVIKNELVNNTSFKFFIYKFLALIFKGGRTKAKF